MANSASPWSKTGNTTSERVVSPSSRSSVGLGSVRSIEGLTRVRLGSVIIDRPNVPSPAATPRRRRSDRKIA
jgi:hypothetical protein